MIPSLRRWLHRRTPTCCDLHGPNCEPPSELCCASCSEAEHPSHPLGVACTWSPSSPIGWSVTYDPRLTSAGLPPLAELLADDAGVPVADIIVGWPADHASRPTNPDQRPARELLATNPWGPQPGDPGMCVYPDTPQGRLDDQEII